MKIAEVLGADLIDTMILRSSPDKEDEPRNNDDKIPQVGYGIKIGKKVVPTPRYNSDNSLGQVNRIIGG